MDEIIYEETNQRIGLPIFVKQQASALKMVDKFVLCFSLVDMEISTFSLCSAGLAVRDE